MVPRSLPGRRPALAAVLLALLAMAAGAARGAVTTAASQEGRRPSLVVITISSLRGDRVPENGSRGSRAPFLLALGEQGALLQMARTPVPATVPALASLFTGLDPYLHGVYLEREPAMSVSTLGERLAAAGYSGQAWLNAEPEAGMPFLTRGIDEVRAVAGTSAGELARQVVAGAAASLAGGSRFLWIHLGDTSFPYRPALGDLLAFRGDGWNDLWEFDLAVGTYRGQPDTMPFTASRDGVRQAAFHMDAYDASVREVDRAVETLATGLLPALKQCDGYMVVAALHGESLGEHRHWFAADATQHEEELVVPVLVMGPDVQPLDHPMDGSWASLIDVKPSLEQLLGLPGRPNGRETSLPEMRGFDLAPLLRGDAPPPSRWLPSGQAQAPFQRSLLVEGRWKMILTPPRPPMYQGDTPWPAGEQVELYDLELDSLELENVAAARGDISARLARHLRLRYPPWPGTPPAEDTSRRR